MQAYVNATRGQKTGGLLHELARESTPLDLLAQLQECCMLGGHRTVAAHPPGGVPLGLTLPAPQHLGIAPQGARRFRDPVALFGHQTDRFSVCTPLSIDAAFLTCWTPPQVSVTLLSKCPLLLNHITQTLPGLTTPPRF